MIEQAAVGVIQDMTPFRSVDTNTFPPRQHSRDLDIESISAR